MRDTCLRMEVGETGIDVLEIAKNDRNTAYVKYASKCGED